MSDRELQQLRELLARARVAAPRFHERRITRGRPLFDSRERDRPRRQRHLLQRERALRARSTTTC